MIFTKLRQLRFLLRLFTAVDGMASALLAIAGLLVLDLFGDRFFEFSQWARVYHAAAVFVFLAD